GGYENRIRRRHRRRPDVRRYARTVDVGADRSPGAVRRPAPGRGGARGGGIRRAGTAPRGGAAGQCRRGGPSVRVPDGRRPRLPAGRVRRPALCFALDLVGWAKARYSATSTG